MSGLTYAGGSTYYTIAESPGATGKVESWCLYRMSVSLDDAGTKITGITLNKLDGSAKGGIIISIKRELGIPVKFIGVGEKIDDMQEFDPDDFVAALFGDN